MCAPRDTAADEPGLAMAGRHHLGPFGLVPRPLPLEDFQGPYMVHRDAILRAAQLTGVDQEPL